MSTERESFKAVDQNGKVYKVIVTKEFQTVQTHTSSGKVLVGQAANLEDGRPLTRMNDDNTFKIVGTDLIIRRQ